MRQAATVAILTFGALIPGAGGAAAADLEAGRALAEAWCSACHAVGPDAEVASDAAPSFVGMATAELTPGELRARIAAPHPPMPQIDPSEAQLEDLVAYIESLSGS
ncbi:c-type cytochrome [Halovulum sp. GXIMD14794]